MTSVLVIRPSLPEPNTIVASRSCSSRRRRTAGLVFIGPCALLATGCATFSATGFVSATGAATAPSPSSRIASTSPATTVVPFSTKIFAIVPVAGAGTSRTTLSVSRSTRFSSLATASPAFLCQATNVASLTDSGSGGTFISILIWSSVSFSQARLPCSPQP